MATDAHKPKIPVIDALKAIASQLIVWHHLTIYGPMADAVYPQAPGILDWMEQRARIAVQVFLVIGGFLASRALFRRFEQDRASVGRLVLDRYVRLARPYLIAVVAAILAGAFARAWLPDPANPPQPTFSQVIAHIFLLQDIAGEEALSAGVWYIAIDFQLYAMLALLLWASKRVAAKLDCRFSAVASWVCGSAAVASLFWWNRNPTLDVWAPYFFGSYGLGIFAERISASKRIGWKTAALTALVALALALQWRDRILVAGLTAVLLACASGIQPRWTAGSVFRLLGRISYSVFVIHYPVCLAVNTVVFHFWRGVPLANGLGMFSAWLLSLAGGALLYRTAEERTHRAELLEYAVRLLSRTRTSNSRQSESVVHALPVDRDVASRPAPDTAVPYREHQLRS